jgi:DHA3 family tetracycline resistance protein-like MFS transporter
MGLGSLMTALPIVGGGAFFLLLAILVRLLVPERGFSPHRHDASARVRRFVGMLTDGLRSIRGSKVLVAMIALTVLFGAFSEGFDRLRDARLIRGIGIPEPLDAVVWIGMISIATRVLVSLAAHALERRTPRMRRPGGALAVLILIVACTVFLFAWASSFPLAFLVLIIGGSSRGLIDPIRSIWINRYIPSSVRATVLSTYGQADAIGQIALGPAIGLLATRAGMPLALTVAAAVLLPTAVVALASDRHDRDVRREARRKRR